MNTAELFGVAGFIISGLLGIVVALVSWTYTTNKRASEKTLDDVKTDAAKSIDLLVEQNRGQALDIATLKQQVQDGGKHDDRVLSAIDRLNEKVDKLTNEVFQLMRRSSGGYPGTMPAVRGGSSGGTGGGE